MSVDFTCDSFLLSFSQTLMNSLRKHFFGPTAGNAETEAWSFTSGSSPADKQQSEHGQVEVSGVRVKAVQREVLWVWVGGFWEGF